MPTAFYDFCGLLMKLHLLMQMGQGGSEEANKLREEMEGLWQEMSEREQEESRVWSALMYDFEDYKNGEVIQRPSNFSNPPI